MKLVVGLGNPGPKYETTRHNIGFLAVDRMIDEFKARGPTKKHEAEIFEAEIAGEKTLFIKPQTFMNLSGKSVAPLVQFYKLAPTDVVVFYDELDLKPMQMRIKAGGGSGGHNGIKSIDSSIGALNIGYYRVRLGIGHPRMFNSRQDPADYVLSQFSQEECADLDALFTRACEALKLLVQGDAQQAMTLYNRENSDGI